MKKQMFYWGVFGMLVLMCLLSFPGLAQNLSDVDNAVKTQGTSARSIIRTAIDIAFGIGLLLVIWAYLNKRQDAKDWLIYFLIALMVYGVFRTTILAS